MANGAHGKRKGTLESCIGKLVNGLHKVTHRKRRLRHLLRNGNVRCKTIGIPYRIQGKLSGEHTGHPREVTHGVTYSGLHDGTHALGMFEETQTEVQGKPPSMQGGGGGGGGTRK